MTWITRRSEWRLLFLALLAIIILCGCSTPSSVVPLLQITERALTEESARLEDDAKREQANTRSNLDALEDAYLRDLQQAEQLTPQWVSEATAVYVIARETLLTHQASLAEAQRGRAENLRTAASATKRAIVLIEQQEGLLNGVGGENLEQLLHGFDVIQRNTTNE